MTTKSSSLSRLNAYRVNIVTWENLGNGDDGSPVELVGSSDRTIQFFGTFGTGGTILLEGSNDGTHYQPLTDPQGNNISKTADSMETIIELTRFVRPRVTAGDGTTSITAILLMKAVR